jgi:hypothetical protein
MYTFLCKTVVTVGSCLLRKKHVFTGGGVFDWDLSHTHTQVQRPAHVGGFSDSAQQGGPATSPPLHDRSQRAQHVGPAPPRDAPYGTLHADIYQLL